MAAIVEINKSWTLFKEAVDARNLSIRYAQNDSIYMVYAIDSEFLLSTRVDKDNGEAQQDFETNYKSGALEI